MKFTTKLTTTIAALLVLVVLVPQTVRAQAVPDRAALLEAIQVLLVQIQNLQLLLDERRLSELGGIESIAALEDFAGEVENIYYVTDELRLPTTAVDTHQRYADQLRQVLPPKYRDYIDQFVVFNNNGDAAAFVHVEFDGVNPTWTYGVDAEEVVNDPTSNLSVELMVHEFAHIFSLDQFVTSSAYTDDCHEYFDEGGCYTPGSYLDTFIDEFWDEELLDELVDAKDSSRPDQALKDFYETWDSEFVSDYAATDPAEDFAETFAWYVLDEEVEQGSIAAEKVKFMGSYAAIRSYKTHINSQI